MGQCNITLRKEYQREYRNGNSKLAIQVEEWHKSHLDYLKQWRESHPEYFKEWHRQHPGYFKQWRKKNREYYNKYKREYMRRYRNGKKLTTENTEKNTLVLFNSITHKPNKLSEL